MKFTTITILFISMITTIQSQEINKPESVLQYLVRQPKIKTDKIPLIILLHGVGSNEEDLFSFANQLPSNFLVISARAPFTIGPNSYAWYHIDYSGNKTNIDAAQEEISRKKIIAFIHQLKTQYSFDDKQVYLCGFSQGAIMSYSIGLTQPDLVKGIAVMSGRLLDEIKPLIVSKDKLKNLKVFISHGTNDKVLNIKYARESKIFLKTLNINPLYKEYNEEHSINQEMFYDLVEWLTGK